MLGVERPRGERAIQLRDRAHAEARRQVRTRERDAVVRVVRLDLGRAPISYLGTSLVARKSLVRQDPRLYEAVLKGTIDSMRFFFEAREQIGSNANDRPDFTAEPR